MRRLRIACLLLGILAVVACGEDPQLNNSNLGSNNIPEDDADDTDDGGEPDGDQPDAGDGGPDGGQDGGDSDSGVITDLCDGIVDLGELSAGSEPRSVEDTADGTALLDPSCGAETNNEVVFAFTVSENLDIDAQVTSSDVNDWVLSLYEGDCDSQEEVSCEESNSDSFIVESGESYLLAVEPAEVGVDGSFELQLDASAIQCTEVGQASCDERGRRTTCETGYNEVAYNCAYDCEGGACGGDVCDTALEVDTSSSQTFGGDYEGYTDEFNFDGRDDCGHTGTGPNTPGEDLVFSLPGLSQDDEVTVDASNGDGQYAFFVLDECATDIDCVSGGLEVDDALDWTVPADGDYYIVVDMLDPTDSPTTEGFEIQIE